MNVAEVTVLVFLSWTLLTGCGGGDDKAEVHGSAKLPECDEAPVRSLDSTVWYDTGTLLIQSQGCELDEGSSAEVCPLQWGSKKAATR
jgi:hypothetical protein